MSDERTIHGLLLAAGAGERFRAAAPGRNKLMAPWRDGQPVVVHALLRLQAAVDGGVIALVPAADEALAALLRSHGATVIASADSARGMGGSLAAGAHAVPDSSALVVALGDMPAITAATYHAVIDALRDGASIVQPRCDGRPGHPVGFAARWLPRLRALDGDSGARTLLREHADDVSALATDDAGCVLDIDTPQDLDGLLT